jgi:hypothetical protein
MHYGRTAQLSLSLFYFIVLVSLAVAPQKQNIKNDKASATSIGDSDHDIPSVVGCDLSV